MADNLPGNGASAGGGVQDTPRSGGDLSRRHTAATFLYVLLAVSLVAVIATAYWWYVWYVTAETCLYAYILPQGAGGGQEQQHSLLAILKQPGAWRDCSWRDYFVALDITSIAALTLSLFFTWLAYSGMREHGLETLPRGEGVF